jgi:geranylgeranyl diphosphate synthase, type II
MFANYIRSDFESYFKTINNSKITEILNYSLKGGKCIRGFIVKHIMNTLSDNKINFWEPIVSIELLHNSSLILDDLPCMDNDIYRRGQKTTFVKFGERQAILFSFYIVSESFKLLFQAFKNIKIKLNDAEIKYNDTYFNADKQLELIYSLVDDWNKLIGENLIVGQLLDLKEDITKLLNIDIDDNDYLINIYKTTSLFIFSFILGAIYSGNPNIDIEQFKKMGLNLGIMYQIMDDFCDIKEDINNTNFVKINGYKKSLEIYSLKKNELVILLKYNKLYTNEMKILIQNIDTKLNKKFTNSANNDLFS